MLKLQPLGVENLQWVVKLSELNIAQQMGAFWPAMALGEPPRVSWRVFYL
ncbi:hypothetical protein [Escherichia coli]